MVGQWSLLSSFWCSASSSFPVLTSQILRFLAVVVAVLLVLMSLLEACCWGFKGRWKVRRKEPFGEKATACTAPPPPPSGEMVVSVAVRGRVRVGAQEVVFRRVTPLDRST